MDYYSEIEAQISSDTLSFFGIFKNRSHIKASEGFIFNNIPVTGLEIVEAFADRFRNAESDEVSDGITNGEFKVSTKHSKVNPVDIGPVTIDDIYNEIKRLKS